MRRQEIYGYEVMSVEVERRAGYGKSGCNLKINVDGDVLCVVNEGLEGVRGMLMWDGVCWFGGARGGW